MIALLDYGSGNLRSAERALATTGKPVLITSDFDTALNAEGLVVPGVGAFGRCMNGLRALRGDELIRRRFAANRPTLGICVGMQVLFAGSSESEGEAGVGIFTESIEKLDAPITPHMGWNKVATSDRSQLFKGIDDGLFYFVHSYAYKGSVHKESVLKGSVHKGMMDNGNAPSDTLFLSHTVYGEEFVAALEFNSLSATQFHPEKSGDVGLQLLDNWAQTL